MQVDVPVRVIPAKARGELTYLNVYLATGERVGSMEMNTRQALRFARELLAAVSVDLQEE